MAEFQIARGSMASDYDYSDIVGRRPYRPFTTYVPADRMNAYSPTSGQNIFNAARWCAGSISKNWKNF